MLYTSRNENDAVDARDTRLESFAADAAETTRFITI